MYIYKSFNLNLQYTNHLSFLLDIQKLVISFPKLYQLTATSNLITNIQIKSSNTKWTNENLNLLDLSDNELTVIDEDLTSLLNITRLQLSSNTLNKVCA